MTPIQTYLTVRGGLDAVRWYCDTWGAKKVRTQMADDGNRLLHASLEVFGGEIMLSDEFPEYDDYVASPKSKKGTTVTIHINMADRSTVDGAMSAATNAGANTTMLAAEMPWGAYYGRLIDPFGHSWSFGTD